MKVQLGGKIMTEFARLGTNAYFYLIDDDSGDKKLKEQKVSHKTKI